ncbi:hypothetical protein NE681_17685, partial [Faecalibacillus intestinalis]|nr:hypothetical protein [Faecalibacillus intestinalis]
GSLLGKIALVIRQKAAVGINLDTMLMLVRLNCNVIREINGVHHHIPARQTINIAHRGIQSQIDFGGSFFSYDQGHTPLF